MCWECYNCVKICPQQAVDVRGYADFVPLGASVTPMRGSEDSIMWTVKFRNGWLKRFKFPIRTTVKGKAQPMAAMKPADDLDERAAVHRARISPYRHASDHEVRGEHHDKILKLLSHQLTF